ncbi:MAG: hypothetical protein IJ602_06065 [Paludibacteraceae bacterium]|nr:hypothetical protein [Paludibacteraceae bacterium]
MAGKKRVARRGVPNPKGGKLERTKPRAFHANLVERYGIGGIIRELRYKGTSYRDIADYVNNNKLIPNGYKIGYGAIARWCAQNDLGGDMTEETDRKAVNIYRRNCEMLGLINTAIDVVSVQLDEMNKNVRDGTVKTTDLKDLIVSLDKLAIRQQSLTQDIGQIQEKIYRYEVVGRAMQLIMDIVRARVDKDTYQEITEAFGENPTLVEAIREIAPSNV